MTEQRTNLTDTCVALMECGAPFLAVRKVGDAELVSVHSGADESVVALRTAEELRDLCEAADQDVCFVIPYNAVRERGLDCIDDETRILAFRSDQQRCGSLAEIRTLRTEGATCQIEDVGTDADYMKTVERAKKELIESGEGCNFVFRRDVAVQYNGSDVGFYAWNVFTMLLGSEAGAYWTYLWFSADQIIVGASPETHMRIDGRTAEMTPISGTFRWADADADGLRRFLSDEKEIHELNMVVDEELKIMTRVCSQSVRIKGPWITTTSSVLHTGYTIEGQLDTHPIRAISESLIAPTIVGSPIASACKHIAATELTGRGYYGGVVGTLSKLGTDGWLVDTAIIIRSIELDNSGRGKCAAGATIVAQSNPASELREVKAKVLPLVNALHAGSDQQRSRIIGPELRSTARLDRGGDLHAELMARNELLSPFWFGNASTSRAEIQSGHGLKALLVDMGDDFVYMLKYVLTAFVMECEVVHWDSDVDVSRFDLVGFGPGPGDPRVLDARSASLCRLYDKVVQASVRWFAVCLSHQLIAQKHGYELRLKGRCGVTQGTARSCRVGEQDYRIGFYNSYEVVSSTDGQVHDLITYSKGFSCQWHPESILSRDGIGLFYGLFRELLVSYEG